MKKLLTEIVNELYPREMKLLEEVGKEEMAEQLGWSPINDGKNTVTIWNRCTELLVSLNKLAINDAYQRPAQPIALEIAKNFEYILTGVIIVYQPSEDGIMEIIDGQERCIAALLRGLTAIPAFIYRGKMTQAELASKFIQINEVRQEISNPDDWHSHVTAGKSKIELVDGASVKFKIQQILEKYQMSGINKPGYLLITNAKPLVDIYSNFTEEAFTSIISGYRKFTLCDKNYHPTFMRAVAQFKTDCDTLSMDFDSVIEKIASVFDYQLIDNRRKNVEHKYELTSGYTTRSQKHMIGWYCTAMRQLYNEVTSDADKKFE